MNPFVESWIGKAKAECLDHFVFFGEDHLRHVVHEYVEFNNARRPHSSLGNLPPGWDAATVPKKRPGARVKCDARLGGLLRHYFLRAA